MNLRIAMALSVLLLAAACTGGSSGEPSPTTPAPTESPSPSPSPEPQTTLASGEAFPATCRERPAPATGFPIAVAAGGYAWAVSRGGDRVRCMFPIGEPGPFTWGPLGDRVLLDDLQIVSVGAVFTHPAGDQRPASTSWGHPEGKAVVFVPPDGRSLQKVLIDDQDLLDVTPMTKTRYLSVDYHWSGLGLAFAVERQGSGSIWFSSNLGEEPRELVFTEEGTEFGAIAFEGEGRYLFYAAQHAEGYPELHRLDLTTGEIPGLWKGDVGEGPIRNITPGFAPGAAGFDLGRSCDDGRAMALRAGDAVELLPDESRPTRVVRWLDRTHLVVAAGPCDGPVDVFVVDAATGEGTPVVLGADAVGVRAPLPSPDLPVGADVEVPPGAA